MFTTAFFLLSSCLFCIVQILDGELNMEKWKAGTGVYVTPLRMMDDGSYCLYQPGDKISVSQLDGTSKVYEVLAVVNIPKALQTPLQVDMGLDYIFPSSELLGKDRKSVV